MKGYRVQVVAVSMYNYMEHYSNQITSDSVLGMYSFNEEVNCDKWVVGSHFHLGLLVSENRGEEEEDERKSRRTVRRGVRGVR